MLAVVVFIVRKFLYSPSSDFESRSDEPISLDPELDLLLLRSDDADAARRSERALATNSLSIMDRVRRLGDKPIAIACGAGRNGSGVITSRHLFRLGSEMALDLRHVGEISIWQSCERVRNFREVERLRREPAKRRWGADAYRIHDPE
jgi:hypothetical protein